MKRKGFTLVELLAVIIVLGIIALITTPIVLGVIERARKQAFRDSVYGIIESANVYIANNFGTRDGEFVCNGEKCYQDTKKLDFKGEVPISGSVVITNNKVTASILSNGRYCANGSKVNLKIATSCIELDETPAEIDKNKLGYTSTTNSVSIILPSDFAFDRESGIQEYQVTLNGETKIIEYDETDQIVTFYGLKQDTEYEAMIKVINHNNLEKEVSLLTKTLLLTNPTITLTNTPATPVNDYLKSQVANIYYNSTNVTNPQYFVKTTRMGISNVAITESCGSGVTPGTCTSIASTTNLSENTWYKVSGNVSVTYNQASDTKGTIYAITYDGNNYSGAATGTISKITKIVGYQVKHYQMNIDGNTYTLKDIENLTGYAHYPVTPNRKNYSGFGTPSLQTVTVSGDGSTVVNYYYTRNKYTVTVNRGTGIASVSGGGSYYHGASVTVGCTPLTGYHFSSWSGTYGTATFTMPASNVVMTANGVGNTYTVVYNGNGNTSGSTANSGHTYGVARTLTANGFAKTGYRFAGWATSASGNAIYSNSQSVSNLTAVHGGTVTLYAKWTPNTYTVVYNGNGNTSGSTANSSHTYGVARTLTANGFKKTGYTFAGWATSASGNAIYSNSQSVSNLTVVHGGTVTLYAKWTANTNTPYKVNHYQSDVDDMMSFTLKETQNLTGTTGASVTPKVKTYTGFSSPNTQTVKIAADGSTVVNYYYRRKRFDVTFDANGNTMSGIHGIVAVYGSTYGTLPTPSISDDAMTDLKVGTSTQTGVQGAIKHKFLGWYTTKTGGTKITASSKVTATSDHTLYAHWGDYCPSGSAYFASTETGGTNSAVITIPSYGYNYITVTLDGGSADLYIESVKKNWGTKYSISGDTVKIQAKSSDTITKHLTWKLTK